MASNPQVVGFQPILSTALIIPRTQTRLSVKYLLDTAHKVFDSPSRIL